MHRRRHPGGDSFATIYALEPKSQALLRPGCRVLRPACWPPQCVPRESWIINVRHWH